MYGATASWAPAATRTIPLSTLRTAKWPRPRKAAAGAPPQQALSVVEDAESSVRFQIVYEPLLEAGNGDRAVLPSRESQAGVLLVEILVEMDPLPPGRQLAGDLLREVWIPKE